jgi:hypothetical protein
LLSAGVQDLKYGDRHSAQQGNHGAFHQRLPKMEEKEKEQEATETTGESVSLLSRLPPV